MEHNLLWLPIHYHILFKYNLLTYKAINFSQPPYLSSLIRPSDLTQGNRLSVSSSKLNKHLGLRSFTVAASAEWKKLPPAIRTVGSISGFRKQFKSCNLISKLNFYKLIPYPMDNCLTGRRDRSRQTPEKDVLYIIPTGPVREYIRQVARSTYFLSRQRDVIASFSCLILVRSLVSW